MKLTFHATKRNGKLILNYPQAYRLAIEGLSDEQDVSVTIDTNVAKTSSQLGYYWGVVVKTVLSEGYQKQGLNISREQVHETLKEWYKEETEIEISLRSATVQEA